jgi:MoxR-like ATPase
MIFQPNTGEFTAHRGPIFANLVLADEINRAPAKVQSALLEAMQEKQVTIGGKTHALPKPFFVMATQNPVEQEGTYALPEAQMDRFIFKLLVDYPSAEEETILMERWGQVTSQPELVAVSSGEELLELRKAVDRIYVSPEIKGYILNLVRATRALAVPLADGSRTLNFGGSPRACLALYQASRALAWLRGQDHVSPDLVQDVFPDALRHRLNLTYEAEAADHHRRSRRTHRRLQGRLINLRAARRFFAPSCAPPLSRLAPAAFEFTELPSRSRPPAAASDDVGRVAAPTRVAHETSRRESAHR